MIITDFYTKQTEIKNQIDDALADFRNKYSGKNIKKREFLTGETDLFDPCLSDYDKNRKKFEQDFIYLLKTIIKTASYPLTIVSTTSDMFGLFIIIQNTDSKLYTCVKLNRPLNKPSIDEVSFSYAETENDIKMKHKYKTSIENLFGNIIQITTPITQTDYVNLFISHKELFQQVSDLADLVDEISKGLSDEITRRKQLDKFATQIDNKFKAARPILEETDTYVNRRYETACSVRGEKPRRLRDNLF